ncbi:hypothetical protein J2T56_002074 [Natronobacillus azotifigens]|uniref:Uncharacterized protein n=1 Tax=Natronobacillus azotifigens TaxID=472978 RepID=A0A9J6REG4_9BACI|nr:hypothetical protein [Natronobacillus azotifigens]MCZ0703853.1 hypothetical protein [Natronobacillus azotifigens]
MTYYYLGLFFHTTLILLVLFGLIYTVINLKRKKLHQAWWIFVILLTPFFLVSFYNSVTMPYMDLKNAITGETYEIEGTIEDIHFPGGYNIIIINGEEYRRNPWGFKPEIGEKYRIDYLPHSGHIVNYELVTE